MAALDAVVVDGAIYDAFDAAWTPATPIGYPDADFAPPDSGAWAEVSVLWGDAEWSTQGGRNEIVGTVVVQLFDEPGGGYGRIKGHAAVARSIFNRATIGGAIFSVPSAPVRIDARPEDRKPAIQINVTAPFVIEETV